MAGCARQDNDISNSARRLKLAKDYDHLLVELRYARVIECVNCQQIFSQYDKVTNCPNSKNGTHALIPVSAELIESTKYRNTV